MNEQCFCSKLEDLLCCSDQKHNYLHVVIEYTNANKRQALDHQKSILILGGQPKTDFLSKLTIFYTAIQYVEAKLSICAAVFIKNTHVYGLKIKHMNTNVKSLFVYRKCS